LYISYDHRFILKTMTESEKDSLMKLLPDLTDHLCDPRGKSYLAKIYGVYSVQRSGKDSFFILIMECLLPVDTIAVFDLKGSISGRRKLKDPSITTIEQLPKGLICKDLDFLQTQKYFDLRDSDFLEFKMNIEADSLLLTKHHLMDYSLLVGMCRGQTLTSHYERSGLVLERGMVIYLGIIDYLQAFNYRKRLETWALELTRKSAPSCVEPVKYSSRFFAFIVSVFQPYRP
jgi:hypothetical protein